MSEQERVSRPVNERSGETEESVNLTADTDKHQQLKDDLDSLLDEIDEVLEDNAEEFVRNYVQKGGQ